MINIKVKYTSEKAAEIYKEHGLKYATEFSSGFDLRFIEPDTSKLMESFPLYSFPMCSFHDAKRDINSMNDIESMDCELYSPPGKTGGKPVLAYQNETLMIAPGMRAVLGTGVMVEPTDAGKKKTKYGMFLCPRSGLAMKGLTVLNAPGIIDNDYRGEIKVIVQNTDMFNAIYIQKAERICQIVLHELVQASFDISEDLSETERGEKGFGSSGKL